MTEELIPTRDLPASEMTEHEGLVLVRCPFNGVWVPLTDYISEVEGQLLPLIGNVDYADTQEHWQETGDFLRDAAGNHVLNVSGDKTPIMQKVAKDNPVVWKETIRILTAVPQTAPEGGSLEFSVHEDVNATDKFGA